MTPDTPGELLRKLRKQQRKTQLQFGKEAGWGVYVQGDLEKRVTRFRPDHLQTLVDKWIIEKGDEWYKKLEKAMAEEEWPPRKKVKISTPLTERAGTKKIPITIDIPELGKQVVLVIELSVLVTLALFLSFITSGGWGLHTPESTATTTIIAAGTTPTPKPEQMTNTPAPVATDKPSTETPTNTLTHTPTVTWTTAPTNTLTEAPTATRTSTPTSTSTSTRTITPTVFHTRTPTRVPTLVETRSP